jgi:hypothetical protein
MPSGHRARGDHAADPCARRVIAKDRELARMLIQPEDQRGCCSGGQHLRDANWQEGARRNSREHNRGNVVGQQDSNVPSPTDVKGFGRTRKDCCIALGHSECLNGRGGCISVRHSGSFSLAGLVRVVGKERFVERQTEQLHRLCAPARLRRSRCPLRSRLPSGFRTGCSGRWRRSAKRSPER